MPNKRYEEAIISAYESRGDLPPISCETDDYDLGTAGPMVRTLWQYAMKGLTSNIVTDEYGIKYFGAGQAFETKVYTRDIAFSGVLGLNSIYPELMYTSLNKTRALRWDMEFKTLSEYNLKRIDVPWKYVADTERELIEKYRTNSYTRRTDDVVWLWAAGDLLRRWDKADKKHWQWLYDWGKKFFERFYTPFYDSNDGLYMGQATFVDIRFTQKQPFHFSGYPQNWTFDDCITCKATSTNALYVIGLNVMAETADVLNLHDESVIWQKRADELRAAMRRELMMPDGTFTYYKDYHGNTAGRADALGTALAVLADVVTGKQAVKAIENYPWSIKGVPMYHPFFDDNKICYHNLTSWPFVDSFFFIALEHATGKDYTVEHMNAIAYACTDTFYELTNYMEHKPMGSKNQLWSLAGYIGLMRRIGFIH